MSLLGLLAKAGFEPRFFHFDIQNVQNVTASGVHVPPYEVHNPLWEILDPPLQDLLAQSPTLLQLSYPVRIYKFANSVKI